MHDGRRKAARLVKDISKQLEEKLKGKDENILKLNLAKESTRNVLGTLQIIKNKISTLNKNLKQVKLNLINYIF